LPTNEIHNAEFEFYDDVQARSRQNALNIDDKLENLSKQQNDTVNRQVEANIRNRLEKKIEIFKIVNKDKNIHQELTEKVFHLT
jgi:hypothetical protein